MVYTLHSYPLLRVEDSFSVFMRKSKIESIVYAQGCVRKLAALLHAPRAASRESKLFYFIKCRRTKKDSLFEMDLVKNDPVQPWPVRLFHNGDLYSHTPNKFGYIVLHYQALASASITFAIKSAEADSLSIRSFMSMAQLSAVTSCFKSEINNTSLSKLV